MLELRTLVPIPSSVAVLSVNSTGCFRDGPGCVCTRCLSYRRSSLVCFRMHYNRYKELFNYKNSVWYNRGMIWGYLFCYINTYTESIETIGYHSTTVFGGTCLREKKSPRGKCYTSQADGKKPNNLNFLHRASPCLTRAINVCMGVSFSRLRRCTDSLTASCLPRHRSLRQKLVCIEYRRT